MSSSVVAFALDPQQLQVRIFRYSSVESEFMLGWNLSFTSYKSCESFSPIKMRNYIHAMMMRTSLQDWALECVKAAIQDAQVLDGNIAINKNRGLSDLCLDPQSTGD